MQAHVSGARGTVCAEFVEVESGRKRDRPQLAAALAATRAHRAVLVIAKLDRLSRNASFIFTLRDSGVNFQCVDMPDANTLTIGIFATLAQHERELISSRTSAALQAKKEQGASLGKPENLTAEATAKGRAGNVRRAQNNENNRRASSMIEMMHKAGKNYTEIADQLNRAGFRTSRGHSFQATQVMRLYQRSSVIKSE